MLRRVLAQVSDRHRTRSEGRRLLRTLLPSDAEFVAFCLDYFPQIAERFSNGMDRTAKTNLLLETISTTHLLHALRQYDGDKLASVEQQQARHIADSRNPYRGLAAFQVDEAHLFFGREALTQRLVQRFHSLWETAQSPRLLAILGHSGSGKSSVSRAGLLARLVRTGELGEQVPRIAMVKPGERPLESLARALVPLLPAEVSMLPAQRQLALEALLREPRIPGQGLRRFAADLAEIAAAPLLVFVDQFEELYTLCQSTSERNLFIENLLAAVRDRPCQVGVVLTLRTDFVGELQTHHPELGRLVAAQHELVPAMSGDELRDAIAKPAELAGMPLDEATLELLCLQTQGHQGTLPLLEFALTRIWEGMQAGEEAGVTLRKLGGVGGALAGEAEKLYSALSEAEQATARRALVRLVHLGEGTRDTRRRAPLSELCGLGETEAWVLSVLRKFAGEHARLLTLGGEGNETVAEVTHEALFEHWSQLREWIAQSRSDRSLHDRALEAAKLWQRAGRSTGRLWRPPDLDLLRDYQQRKPEVFGATMAEFCAAAQRRQLRELGLNIGAVITILLAVLIAGGVYVAKERQRSQEGAVAREQIRRQLLESYLERGGRLLFEPEKASEGLLWLHRAQGEGSQDPVLPDLLRTAMQPIDAAQAVLIGHTSFVNSASFSPDGQRIVTSSADKTARVWSASDGRLQAELKGHSSFVNNAVFSPDGRRIVTASADYTARVWDADNGQLLAELRGHSSFVNSAVFSPDGRRILTASADRTAKVWDSTTGHLLLELHGHGSFVNSATYSSDGHSLLTASADQTARVWSAESGRLLAELKGHASHVNSAVFSPDGRRIVTASSDHTARVWDVEGRLLAELKGHRSFVNRATFSPDGSRILTASGDKTARVWDARAGRLLFELRRHGSYVNSAMFSPDGHRIVTASADKTARLWDADGGRLLAELRGHGAFVNSAVFSPDGRRIVTSGADKTARLWDAEGGRLLLELSGHESQVNSATFSPDGRRILSASADQTARIWDASTGRLLTTLQGHEQEVFSATFSPDGRHVLTAGADRSARIWSTTTGAKLLDLRGHRGAVHNASYSPDGRRVVTASTDRTARLWDAESGQPLAELVGHRATVLSAVFSPNGRQVLTASWDTTARVWDAETARLIAEHVGHGGGVLGATFSPDGGRIVTASWDNTARVWEAASGKLIAELKGHTERVLHAAFSPDGRRVVTASWDGTARMWDAESGRLLAELKGHRSYVNRAVFSPEGNRIVTASADQTARVWDVAPETRSYPQIARLLRCHVPAQFDGESNNLVVFRQPTPEECSSWTDAQHQLKQR